MHFPDEVGGGFLEHERQDRVNERGTRSTEQAQRETAGEHEVLGIGLVDRMRVAGEGCLSEMPEITGAYRMSGDLDYLLRVRVGSVADYDRFYQRLITGMKAADVSASFVMEEIKEITEVPV